MNIEVHEWEDGAQTVITRDARGVKIHIANYDARHVVTNQTICTHDDKRRLTAYVKYLGNGEVDHFATYHYDGDNNHESSMSVFDKHKAPIYKKCYQLNKNGRPLRADYYDPQGQLRSYEEYVYERNRCSTVRFFDSNGNTIDNPLAG